MVILYSPHCLDYGAAGHPESPERIRSAVAQLHKEFHTWVAPTACAEEDILRVHTRLQLDAVRTGAFEDVDTPFFPEIFEIAKLSAGAAVLAAEHALAGRPAFSLMRPPGHHAERNRVMGFCYFDNIAIAVAKVLASQTGAITQFVRQVGRGGPPRRPSVESRTARRAVPTNDLASEASLATNVQRVAILDFDCHHGNGTEDIFRGNERVLFVSLHQSPCYPGTGFASAGNCLNYPLAPGTGPAQFLVALDEAIERIRNFTPDLLAVSAGFDAYKNDPITHMGLETDTFYEIGRRVAELTRPVGAPSPEKDSGQAGRALPCFAVLEGGYSSEFARCVGAFINGWERH